MKGKQRVLIDILSADENLLRIVMSVYDLIFEGELNEVEKYTLVLLFFSRMGSVPAKEGIHFEMSDSETRLRDLFPTELFENVMKICNLSVDSFKRSGIPFEDAIKSVYEMVRDSSDEDVRVMTWFSYATSTLSQYDVDFNRILDELQNLTEKMALERKFLFERMVEFSFERNVELVFHMQSDELASELLAILDICKDNRERVYALKRMFAQAEKAIYAEELMIEEASQEEEAGEDVPLFENKEPSMVH